jgi:glyoxylase-like metal-dependent hydrolase (beta-lactamase superfamily II)
MNMISCRRVLPALILIVSMLPGAAESQAPGELPLHTERLSDRVLLAWVGDAMQTIRVVAISTERGIVVIEANLIRSFDVRIRRAIEKEFGRSDIRYLINTHFHHDHTCGNQVYADAAIIGHRTVPDGMKSELTGEGLAKLLDSFESMRGEFEKRRDAAAQDSRDRQFFGEGVIMARMAMDELREGFRPTYPSLLFDDRMTLYMGDLTIELYAVGGTHTPSDIMIFIPEEKLVCIGDMIPDRMLPYLRKEGPWDMDAILGNWGRIVESGREIKTVNMAHSDMRVSVETFREQYRYLKTVWEGLRELRSRGGTWEDARKKFTIERDFPYFQKRILAIRGVNIHDYNVEAMWARLGGK